MKRITLSAIALCGTYGSNCAVDEVGSIILLIQIIVHTEIVRSDSNMQL